MKTVLLAVSLLISLAPATIAQPADEYIEIDGSKNPEQIPAWLSWESTFSTLAIARRDASTAVAETLHMSDADQQLVFAAARGQTDRDNACQRKAESLAPLLGKVDVSVINERNREIQLECRQAILDAAESLMNALSPEGRTSMIAWRQKAIDGIRVRVPKGEIDHFRRPY